MCVCISLDSILSNFFKLNPSIWECKNAYAPGNGKEHVAIGKYHFWRSVKWKVILNLLLKVQKPSVERTSGKMALRDKCDWRGNTTQIEIVPVVGLLVVVLLVATFSAD